MHLGGDIFSTKGFDKRLRHLLQFYLGQGAQVHRGEVCLTEHCLGNFFHGCHKFEASVPGKAQVG